MRKIGLWILMVFLLSTFVISAGEIDQFVDRVNYWDSENHVVTVTNNGGSTAQVNITIPSDLGLVSTTCANPSPNLVSCTLNAGQTKSYTVNSSSDNPEYSVSILSPIVNGSYTGNDVKLLKIKDEEVMHTLVEYGRGRGNYFFDSMFDGAGSGHTGQSCSYLPIDTMFELNFLHKINNVKQYFGNLNAQAYNVTFDCTYPNDTIVRQHLITSIVTNNTGAYVSYLIPRIEGSWERMGYLGMDFDAGDYSLGQEVVVNCTDMSYYFPEAGGNFVVEEDSFALEVRDREPFSVNAFTSEIIGNGTQEVLITYVITNNESYPVNDVIIEIQAPPYAEFIGVRGELWGSALDQYRIEKSQLLPNETVVVTLVARFDTTDAPSINSVDLSNFVRMKYTTCWELNAYNPGEYVQIVNNVGNGTVNMSMPSEIVGVINRLQIIYNVSYTVNKTIFDINNTVNRISVIVEAVNQTTQETNYIVRQINNTANIILNQTQIIYSNTNIILNDTMYLSDQLNCNGTVDSPICDRISSINNSLIDLYNFTWMLNYTANNLNITVIETINTTDVNVSVNVDLSNLTSRLREVKNMINCTGNLSNSSLCSRVENIEESTWIINNSLNSIYNLTTYFNNTVFGNYSFQDILEVIDNVTIDTSDVLEALRELREFNEEVVFLITDSFNLQQNAKESFLDGNLDSAMNDLVNANSKLEEASQYLVVERNSLTGEVDQSFSTGWIWMALAGIAVVGVLVYLFGQVPPDKKGKVRFGIFGILAFVMLLVCCVDVAKAQWGPLGTIVQEADTLNFDNVSNLKVNIYYNCTGTRQFNISVPSGFTVSGTGGPCNWNLGDPVVSCTSFSDTHPSLMYGSYTMVTTGGLSDYDVTNILTSLSDNINCSVENDISFIKIPDDEIFYTLVEYGRGRGNYFYSTVEGSAGSGHTGTGCHYVPNGTMFELNFLHKIFNIKQYFDDAYATAKNVTFTCTYPNRTIVRSHLGETISQGSSGTTITYNIDEIEGSWERMGYVGMQFDGSEQYVGQNLTITCTNISYYMPDQNGYVKVYSSGTSFDLEVRDSEPFSVSATTGSVIGNGTQEVLITYNITNVEKYNVDDVVIEIQAPPYAEFIGVRGELWGSALDHYRLEKMYLAPGESEIITLVARFDTSNAPDISTIDLTSGVIAQYITCWDLNAYNPAKSVQRISNVGNGNVNMSIPSEIISVIERLDSIYTMITVINSTTIAVNDTVNDIQTVITIVNSTTIDTNTIVKEINNTMTSIYSNTSATLENTYSIINYTSYMKDLLNCNGTVDSPMCEWLDSINSTISNISDILIDVNNTLNDITVNVTIDLSGKNLSFNVTPDLTNVSIIIEDIYAELNCSMNWTTEPNSSLCWSLARIENNTWMINNSVNDINDMILYFNSTTFGNVTLENIYQKISNMSLDTTDLLEEIRKLREFDEELVFLVTDAFGLQQAAKQDVNEGRMGDAATKLREANSKLKQATVRLVELQEESQSDLSGASTDYSWVLLMVGIIGVLGAGYYLFSAPKDEEKMV